MKNLLLKKKTARGLECIFKKQSLLCDVICIQILHLLAFISLTDSHIPHGEIGNLYDFLYQLKHLKVKYTQFDLFVNSEFIASMKGMLSVIESLRVCLV